MYSQHLKASLSAQLVAYYSGLYFMSSTEETKSHAPAAQLTLASELLGQEDMPGRPDRGANDKVIDSCLLVEWREGQPVTQRHH